MDVQAKIPFDAHELDYIESLDPDADVAFLKRELPWIPDGSLRILQVSQLPLSPPSQPYLVQH